MSRTAVYLIIKMAFQKIVEGKRVPEQIGRYEIRGLIGRGGMADVYRAYDPRFQREVAVKTLPAEFLRDPQFRQRFEIEAVIIARLQQPAIVPVFDFGDDDGRLFLVMRLMEGGSLRERLAGKPIPLLDAARLLNRLAPALDAAHSENIVHRDLKPGNILFDKWDEPYLTDFGIVKLLEDNETALTKTGTVLGTPAYMSPEQVQGEELDGRSDVYALGVILYEMLTGAQPYQASTPFSLAVKHLTEPVPRILDANTNLPPDMQVIIDHALAKDREDRYPSAQALAAELDTLARANDEGVGAAVAAGAGLKSVEVEETSAPPVQADDKAEGAAVVTEARLSSLAVEETAVKPVQAEEIELAANKEVTLLDTPAGGVDEATVIDTPSQPQPQLVVEKKEETEGKTAVSRWMWIAGVAVILLLAGGFYWIIGGGGDVVPALDLNFSAGSALPDGPLAAINPVSAGEIQQLARLDNGAVNGATYSPDGALLAQPSSTGIYLYDAQTLDELLFMPLEVGVNSVAFTPDGETLASGSNDNTIRLWRVATGSVLKTIRGQSDSVNSVAFSPDGETLATGSNDNTIRLWRVATGFLLRTLRGHSDPVNSVAFSPDGERLASGSQDKTVRLWRVATGSVVKTMKGHDSSVNSVAFSPDGVRLASGSDDDTVRLWRVVTGSLLKTMKGHADSVNSVAFTPDGETLASGSDDETVRLWRVASGSVLKTLERHTGLVNSVDFSQNGETLASGSEDGTIRIWGVEAGKNN